MIAERALPGAIVVDDDMARAARLAAMSALDGLGVLTIEWGPGVPPLVRLVDPQIVVAGISGGEGAQGAHARLEALRQQGYARDIVLVADADADALAGRFAAHNGLHIVRECDVNQLVAARTPNTGAQAGRHAPGVSGADRRAAPPLVLDHVTVNLASGEMFGPRGRGVLAPRERAVLTALAANRGTALSRERLLAEAWQAPYPASRVVDRQLRALRVRLERDPERPRHLITVHACGYMLVV